MNKETGRNKGITYGIQKENRRRRWARRAKRQKKRWFSLAFKDGRKHEFTYLKRIVSSIGTLFFWAALGGIALICSWELFRKTGETSFADFYSSEKEEGLMDIEYGKEEREKEEKGEKGNEIEKKETEEKEIEEKETEEKEIEEKETEEKETEEKRKEGEKRINQEEGWFQEFFGVEIRFQDGKITFFREKKGQMKEVK